MKLLSGPLSMYGAKAQIAVAEKGVECDVEMVPFSLKDRYSPTHPDVERLNPKRQVPVLMDGPVEIFDSTQIFEYLEHKFPEPALWPAGIEERAYARLMELKADEIFFFNFNALIRAGGDTRIPEAKAAAANMAAFYQDIDRLLASRDYVAGSYSYADIAWFCASWFASFLGGGPDPALGHLAAWRTRISNRPAVSPVIGGLARSLAQNGIPVPKIEETVPPTGFEPVTP
ncbi:MAG: glutathione S-transferase family protein [Parvibaculum sp.]